MVDVIDELIRVGLMVGAVFQLVCIAAVIWIPTKDDTKGVMSDSSEDDVSNESSQSHQTVHRHHNMQHSSKKLHKKKRR